MATFEPTLNLFKYAKRAQGGIDAASTGSIWLDLRPYCDDRKASDTRSPLARGQIAGLYFRWVIGVALVYDLGLTVADVARFAKCDKGNASRMIRRTCELLTKHFAFNPVYTIPEVVCSSCEDRCTSPFKHNDKPVCSECYAELTESTE
jgi:hypothetical protein